MALNTLQMRYALKNNGVTRDAFGDVYPLDGLGELHERPTLIIVNTDPQDMPGNHWLLFYFTDDSVVEMFDSLGRDIDDYPPDIKTFVSRFVKTTKVSRVRVQPSNTSLCGHYCLHYAYARCCGNSMHSIILDMPKPEWIRCCIPQLFEIPGIVSESQACEKL